MNKCQFPVPAREYAVVFGAVAGGELQLLKSSGTYNIYFYTKQIGRFQFSSSVNFPPTFDACQSKLTALFSHHPKSCQNIHEHDITFQVLTVITEKNKYKKVKVFFF